MDNRNSLPLIDFSTHSDNNSEDIDQQLEDRGIGMVKVSKRTRNNRLTHKDSVDSDLLQDDVQGSQLIIKQMPIKSRDKYPEFPIRPVSTCNTPSCYEPSSPFGNKIFSSPGFVLSFIHL